MEYEIIPAILVDTFDEFIERIEQCEDFAETVQWDIMDGQFVEPMTFSDLKAMQNVDTVLSIEAHLMIENPEELADDLGKAGIDRIIIHAESTDDLGSAIERLKAYDFELGIALNPETEVADIEEFINEVDEVLIMTVVPGASGQSFMPEMLEKVKILRKNYPQLNIGVDGGINLQTIRDARKAGANRFSANSAIFSSPDPGNAFEVLHSAVVKG